MKSTQKKVLRLLAGLSLVVVSSHALAQTSLVQKPPVPQELPSLLEAEVSDWLNRGDFASARARCALEIKSAPLVSEPGALAGSYMCLGEALYGLERYAASVDAFKKTIEQLESSAGVFEPRLALPLEGLGKALTGLGKLEAAERALVKAKDITHRNFGIYNLVQSDIVNRLTKTYLDRGKWPSATREQKFLMRANVEMYGETPQLLPALRRFGKFQERVGKPDLARKTYRRALIIMTRAYGGDDLRLVGPLRDYATSYINTARGSGRVMSRSGAKALRAVIDLYLRQEYSDPTDVARAWGELGDWYVIGGRRGLAREAYVEAGKVLADAGGEKSDLFAKPVEIEYENIPIGMRKSRIGSLPNGMAILEFEFTVTAAGGVTKLTVIRDDLDYARFALEVGQQVKQSRYRPRIVDGVPVDTPGVRKVFRYDFSQFEIGKEESAGDEIEENPVPKSTPSESSESSESSE